MTIAARMDEMRTKQKGSPKMTTDDRIDRQDERIDRLERMNGALIEATCQLLDAVHVLRAQLDQQTAAAEQLMENLRILHSDVRAAMDADTAEDEADWWRHGRSAEDTDSDE